MHPVQVTDAAASENRVLPTGETTPIDAPLPMASKLLMIFFLFFVALFGLISVIDLIASPFR